MKTTYYTYLETPLGKLLLAGTREALTLISFQTGKKVKRPASDWVSSKAPFREVIRQLRDYFAGKRTKFELPIAPEGTAFQRKVWRALQRVPYQKTISYGELARRIGRPSASRAVGAANGSNRLPIVIPCHRVVGADGRLTGFGGGLPLKKALLDLEARHGGGP